jgi:metal-responsive CopG/Arc/MetJ family transcriptional regulator
MKVKTSVTLSTDLLRALEQASSQYKNRSEFLETAAWALLAQLQRAKRNAKDLAILNKKAIRLNREAEDVLAYQVRL